MIEQNNDFARLELSDGVRRAIDEMGFKEATRIQSQSIPVILSGRDVIGHSQTGTGKTAAFGIPVIERIDALLPGVVQALILCPTRELAMQNAEEMRKFSKYTPGVRIVPVYGGAAIDRQIQALKRGAEIVIGTPGRVMDHMRRRTLRLSHVSMVILDEADEMLNMGFREDIETILRDVPDERQTLLFSATMSDEIMAITERYQREPVLVKIASKELTVPNIRQFYYDVPPGRKPDALARLFDFHNPRRAMVFCNTKRTVDELANDLRARGYMVEALHGDMKQASRSLVMDVFKGGRSPILIATDVAARGLDIDDVDIVFNYDLPQDMEYYVHRIGRTGRAGKSGASFTLVSGSRQVRQLKNVERYTRSRIESAKIPTLAEVSAAKGEKLAGELRAAIESGIAERHRRIVSRLVEEGFDPEEIAGAALALAAAGEKEPTGGVDDFVVYERERKARAERFAKPERKPLFGRRKSMARLVINVGKRDNVGANHIMGAFAGETGLAGKAIGSIEIGERQTVVEVPTESAEMVIRAMKNCRIKGKVTTTRAE